MALTNKTLFLFLKIHCKENKQELQGEQAGTVSVSENPLQGEQAGTVSVSENSLTNLLSTILADQTPIDSDFSRLMDNNSSKRIDVEAINFEIESSKKLLLELQKKSKTEKELFDLEATKFEINRIKKLLLELQKEKNKAERQLFFSNIEFEIVAKCNFHVVIPRMLFHDIISLFSEPQNNPLLAILLLKHIIDNSTVEINREWAQCFLALAVLRGDVITYDCREIKSTVYRIQNHSNPKLADECMIDIKTKCVRTFYKHNRQRLLLEFAPSAYSESAQRYIQEHKIQRGN
jgi:hypothetical protein